MRRASKTEGTSFNRYDWTFDKAGNQLSEPKTPPGGTATTSRNLYPSTSNRLTSIGQGTTTLRSFLVNGAADITKDTHGATATDYATDNAGRLRTVTVAGSLKGTYTCDGMERLAIRAVTNSTPSGTTHFIHLLGGGGLFDELMPTVGPMLGGPGNRVIAETNGAGVSLREYIWLGDQVLAVVANANTKSAVMDWGERRRAQPGGTIRWIDPIRRTP